MAEPSNPEAGISEAVLRRLEILISIGMGVARADMGTVQLFGGGDSLRIVANQGLSQPFLDHFNSDALALSKRCPFKTAMKSGSSVMISDVAMSGFVGPDTVPTMLNAKTLAVMAVPIITQAGNILGALSVHWREVQTKLDLPDEFAALAKQIASYLESMPGTII